MNWNLAEAKNRLTEVVNLALTEGPQTITRRNDTVVLISAADFAELTGRRNSFKDYLTQGEPFEGLDLTRDRSPMREVEPVAKLVPATAEKARPDVRQAVAEMLAYRDKQGPTLEGLSVRDLINEGRR